MILGGCIHINDLFVQMYPVVCLPTNDDFAGNSIYEKLLNDKLSVNPRYLYENTAVQMLTANGMNCSTAHL